MTVGQNNTPTASYQATPGEEKEIYIEPSVDSLLPYNSNIDLLNSYAKEELKKGLYMGEELLIIIPRLVELNQTFIPILFLYFIFISFIAFICFLFWIEISLEMAAFVFLIALLVLTVIFIIPLIFLCISIYACGSKELQKSNDFVAVTRDRMFLSEESCYRHNKYGQRIGQINPKSIQFRNIDDIKIKFNYFTYVYTCSIHLKEGWRTHYESKYAVYDFYLFATKKKEEMDKYLNIINHIRDKYWEVYDKKKIETTAKYIPEPIW
eukprot:TRINITY_DN152_c0_g1_i1.p1 TRINITY_DN152_c0_g1~~TRINITY_DN152_c0_g1_i1.p1  ORF type:complete len:266 (-),score=53.59 TRINITY_DN152_c0_g1_i1:224-1021(-)